MRLCRWVSSSGAHTPTRFQPCCYSRLYRQWERFFWQVERIIRRYVDRTAAAKAAIRQLNEARKGTWAVKLPVKLYTGIELSLGAGEGNRTLVCSLGSGMVFKHIKGLAAKLTLFASRKINRLSTDCKTFRIPRLPPSDYLLDQFGPLRAASSVLYRPGSAPIVSTLLRAAKPDAVPFFPRFGMTVASTPTLVSAPLCNARLSAAAKAWLAAISCSRSVAGSAGTMGGPDHSLLWRSMLISFSVSILTTRSLFGPHCHCGCNRGCDFLN
jgi:hypothetical protein